MKRSRNSNHNNNNLAAPRAFTEPTNILISSDWRIGAAFLLNTCPPLLHANDGKMTNFGSIVLFPCPHNRHCNSRYSSSRVEEEEEVAHSLKIRHVKMSSFNAFTMRNLLWKVDSIPSKKRHAAATNLPLEGAIDLDNCLCDSILEVPGYLLLNDEYEGFRLTWITDSSWTNALLDPGVQMLQKLPSMSKTPTKPNIVTKAECSSTFVPWKEQRNDRQGGVVMEMAENQEQPESLSSGRLLIAFEAYLSIPNILDEILKKRKSLSYMFSSDDGGETSCMPDYCYNLLSAQERGRTVDLVICCKASDRVGCIGVFVTLDLFTQQYKENLFLQNSTVADCASLQKLCNSLALNQRMRQRKLGPYSVDPTDKMNWETWLCEERFFYSGYDHEMARDLDPSEWKPLLDLSLEKRKNGSTCVKIPGVKPKSIPYASLYPAEIFMNKTISAVVPAAFLTGRRSPTRLLYR